MNEQSYSATNLEQSAAHDPAREEAVQRPLALVTGASTGIGYELARCCVENGYYLLIVADEPQIHAAAERLRIPGASVEAVEGDLATLEGVDRFYDAAKGRRIDTLVANAGRGLGNAFLDQDFAAMLQTHKAEPEILRFTQDDTGENVTLSDSEESLPTCKLTYKNQFS
jgi:NAD(P)-dependent dehydrogenase (short-subunit alcohol dehydrogenase family)